MKYPEEMGGAPCTLPPGAEDVVMPVLKNIYKI